MIDPENLRRGAAAAGLVTQMVVSTMVCGGLGTWLDGRFATGPKLGLGGLVVGFALGMSLLLRYLLAAAPPDPESPTPRPPDA
jgi:F0F1-type ATP synthase assembly protein I